MEQLELLFAAVGRTVVAMDRFNGRPVWRLKLPRLFAGSISMVLPHGNEVYVGRGGYVYCLDRQTGNVLWERGMDASGSLTLLAVAGTEGQQQAAVGMHAAAAQAAATAGATVAITAAASSG